MKTDLFQSCGHCWVFQICWHVECSTFTASSFRIWNSSTGIPSPPPLALFIVMLSKAHLTSHSRMSGSRWVITPSWLSWLRRRQWQATPVLLPRKSHGWRRLVGCSPWGCYKSDAAERLHFHFSLSHNGEGNGNPLQCSCLENPRDGRAWWAAVYGVAQSRTRLKQLSSSSSMLGLYMLSNSDFPSFAYACEWLWKCCWVLIGGLQINLSK